MQRLGADLETLHYHSDSNPMYSDEEEENVSFLDREERLNHLKEKYDHPPADASEWADEREKFADFLATLSRLSAKIGKIFCHNEF